MFVLFQLLHFDTLWRSFILIADGVVMATSVALLPNLVLLTHLLVSEFLSVVLMLHELPSFYVPAHLIHSARLDHALLM